MQSTLSILSHLNPTPLRGLQFLLHIEEIKFKSNFPMSDMGHLEPKSWDFWDLNL